MVDGSRKRRSAKNLFKRRWYADCRARRFARRFGLSNGDQICSRRDGQRLRAMNGLELLPSSRDAQRLGDHDLRQG